MSYWYTAAAGRRSRPLALSATALRARGIAAPMAEDAVPRTRGNLRSLGTGSPAKAQRGQDGAPPTDPVTSLNACLLETGLAMTLEMSSINAPFPAPSNYARPLPTSASIASFPTAGFLAIRPFSPIKKAAGVARMLYAFDTLHFRS